MAWELAKVPKVAHFFWDDQPMSFLRWMTLRSFSVLNPEWKLVLHTCGSSKPNWGTAHNKQVATENLRARLGEIDRLEVREEDHGLGGLAGVQQSDILRNRYLYEEGGIWSDMDILFYRPVKAMLCNAPEHGEAATGLCMRGGWFPIGFMASAKGSPYFKAVHDAQMSMVHTTGRSSYQQFGTGVYKSILASGDFKTFPIDPIEVYQHSWGAHERIFRGQIDLEKGIGIHWYGGSASAAVEEPLLTEGRWKDHPLSKVIEVTA